jgi:hypothetical protein
VAEPLHDAGRIGEPHTREIHFGKGPVGLELSQGALSFEIPAGLGGEGRKAKSPPPVEDGKPKRKCSPSGTA